MKNHLMLKYRNKITIEILMILLLAIRMEIVDF